MKQYFTLQYKLLNRKLYDFGFPVLIGYAVFIVLFVLLSKKLFSDVQFAEYIYVFIALGFVIKLSEVKRNNFLKLIFKRADYLTVRAIENLLYAIPFIAFLLFKGKFLAVLLLLISVLVLALLNFNIKKHYVMPTPFGKTPFEFVVGFRKTFIAFLIAYFLAFMAVYVKNFNLGIFSIIFVAVVCFTFYSKLENSYFVWNYNTSAKLFLLEKIKTAVINYSFLAAPIVLVLSVFFFMQIHIVLLFFALAVMYLITIIFAKYSVYPNEISIPQVFLFLFSLYFPPLLIALIPYFYSQSVKRLQIVLK